MRLRRLTVSAIVLVAGGCGSSGDAEPGPSPSGSDRAARSDLVLSARLTPDKPGCSAAVGVDGQVVWTGARGLADVASGTPIGAATVFDVGSVSKQFTATAVLMLAGEGALSTEDTLAKRVPGLPAWAGQMTIAQAMRHTTGIPDYFAVMEKQGRSLEESTSHVDAVRIIATMPRLDFKPGAKFAYSNSNYVLLAEVVRHVSGTPLPEFLQQRVFGPLGLDMAMAPAEKIAGKAVSYSGLDLKVTTAPITSFGDGGVQSTPSELVRWADNYRTGKVGGPPLLAAQVAAPVPSDLGQGQEGYAAGILVSADGALWHAGLWLGYATWFEVTPDRHTAVAVACNAANHGPGPMAEQLRRIWS